MHLACLLLLVVVCVRAQVCLNATGYVTTDPAALCVYCNLQGNLVGHACNCTAPGLSPTCAPITSPVAGSVNSTCGYNLCHDDDSVCVLSTGPGPRCQECMVGGWINGTMCVCYNSLADPLAYCALLVDTQTSVRVLQNVTSASCNYWQNPSLGYYADAFNCLLPTLGPVPNEALLQDECNTYGGPDPLAPQLGFATCSGHGAWNATSYSCECADFWTLEPIGPGLDNTTAFSCTECALWYGPPSPEPGACSLVFAPDPLDGIVKECSGHGWFRSGACQCEFGQSVGYWELLTLPNSTAQTCAQCLGGYSPLSNCTDSPSPVRSPTAAPILTGQLYMAVVQANVTTWPPIGLIGNRSSTDERCLGAFTGCSRAHALMCYADDPLVDMPAAYGFSATANIIYLNTTGSDSLTSDVGSFQQYIAGEGLIMGYVGSSLLNVGYDAYVVYSYGCFMNASSVPLDNSCQDYTTTSGVLESPVGGVYGCGVQAGLVCLCTASDMTAPPAIMFAPTTSPTT